MAVASKSRLMLVSELIETALTEPRDRAFGERLGAAQWRYTSSTRMRERAAAIASALRAAGARQGDRVVLIANNSVDWLAVNFGIHYAGCVVVPIFATLAHDQTDYIFKDSAAKLAFVETSAAAGRIRADCPSAPRLIHFDGVGENSLGAFEASATVDAAPAEVRSSFAAGIGSHDLAVLIYTSGTTGHPKGVMLLNSNIVSNAHASSEYSRGGILEEPGDPVLSVLPFAHIYEHNNILGYLLRRAEIHVSTPEFLIEDLKSVRPKFLAFVPRMFERILAGIVGKAVAGGGVRAKLVPWALQVGHDYCAATVESRKSSPMLPLQYAVAQRLVLSKIKPAAGLDRVASIVSGSAPLHRDIALTFAGIGLSIMEGYGLTETSPVLTSSRAGAARYGSVGKPIPGVELRIADDGEILARGPSVMKGYYNLPAEDPFTEDGWFKTGDVGNFDADGFLYITDRKKELIKTSGGKYIAPSRVESALKRSIYIGQCFIVGDGRPFPIALVCPDWKLVRKQLEIAPDESNAALVARSDVLELMLREVKEKTADLATFEQIRRIALLPRDLTVEDGELSPTMKVKRRVVEQKFAALIASAYAPSVSAH